MTDRVRLRTETPGDQPFLLELFIDVRAGEFAALEMPAAQKSEVLRLQFRAQSSHWQTRYPQMRREIIAIDGNAAGRLYTDTVGDVQHVVDISLLASQCGQGIGTALLRELQRQTTARGGHMTLHVAMSNPAQRLYDRLGFRRSEKIDSDDIYQTMIWKPA